MKLKFAVRLRWGVAAEKCEFTVCVGKLCSDRCKMCCEGDVGLNEAANSSSIGLGGGR